MKQHRPIIKASLSRDEAGMKKAARELARAGGFRYRHYLVKVDSGRAACIEEFDPPRSIKIRVD